MFTSSGNWAGILIDINADEKPDIQIQTIGKAYPLNTGDVPAAIFINGILSGCIATTWANVAQSKNYIGFKFSRSCVQLPPSNIRVQGYADYIANDGDWYDYAPEGGWWLDFYRWTLENPGVATTTTTSTIASTVPLQTIPNAPTSLSISRISDSAVRLTWIDNSTNEEGFIFQRDDAPVATGTIISGWPYKVTAGVSSWDVVGLETGKRYCLTAAAFNTGGVSKWADWSCIDLSVSVNSSIPAFSGSLSCDAIRGRKTGANISLRISAGELNAGKKLIFEAFAKGNWLNIGSGRVDAEGIANILAKSSVVGLKGKVQIRATQGSRFICEGDIG
jgi:hypothetical protein